MKWWQVRQELNKQQNKENAMQFLQLIESIAKIVTPDNIETIAALVEKLVVLAESMKSHQQPTIKS